jgi:hypothetical protein
MARSLGPSASVVHLDSSAWELEVCVSGSHLSSLQPHTHLSADHLGETEHLWLRPLAGP